MMTVGMVGEKIVHRDVRELEGTSPMFRRVEIAFALAYPVMFVWLAVQLRATLATSPSLVFLTVIAGALMSDFISGIFHWFFDTWFTPTTPYIGNVFVRTFREHHVDQTAICRHDFIETNGSNLLSGCVLVVAGFCSDTPWIASSFLFGSVFMAATSQIHKWAHASEVPRVVALLQWTRIILPKMMHERHHVAPYDRAYCITNGWLNPTLHHTRFFRFLECGDLRDDRRAAATRRHR